MPPLQSCQHCSLHASASAMSGHPLLACCSPSKPALPYPLTSLPVLVPQVRNDGRIVIQGPNGVAWNYYLGGSAIPPATAFQLTSDGAPSCIYSGPIPAVTALRSRDLAYLLYVTREGQMAMAVKGGRIVWRPSGVVGPAPMQAGLVLTERVVTSWLTRHNITTKVGWLVGLQCAADVACCGADHAALGVAAAQEQGQGCNPAAARALSDCRRLANANAHSPPPAPLLPQQAKSPPPPKTASIVKVPVRPRNPKPAPPPRSKASRGLLGASSGFTAADSTAQAAVINSHGTSPHVTPFSAARHLLQLNRAPPATSAATQMCLMPDGSLQFGSVDNTVVIWTKPAVTGGCSSHA